MILAKMSRKIRGKKVYFSVKFLFFCRTAFFLLKKVVMFIISCYLIV